MEPELEKLLEQKNFDRLSQTEKEYVLDNLTEKEYERVRSFLKLAKDSSEKDYRGIHPSSRIKSAIKAAYLQRFDEKDISSFLKANNIFNKSVTTNIWIYTPIAASIILAVVLFFEFGNSYFEASNTRTTAIDMDQIENFDLLQEQMSLKEIGLYSKIIVPEVDVDMSLVRPDTLLIP